VKLSDILAERVAGRMRRYGYPECIKVDVWEVYRTGKHKNAALAVAIKHEFAELQIERST